ncbi:MAG TPA: NUDIX domain-containing protein [Jatrophihabitans sp.]|nr:NUDIX domain-containing protein [Jatrophihabitans sp.]
MTVPSPVAGSSPVPGQSGQPIVRQAGRIFVLDADRRVLLMHERRDIGSDCSHWIVPGGGVEAGESLVQAALREVYEETGLVPELDPAAEPMYSERVHFSFAGRDIDQTNFYFLARVPSGLPVRPTAHTEAEQLVVLGYRWWPLAELAASDVEREPVTMVELIERALAVR